MTVPLPAFDTHTLLPPSTAMPETFARSVAMNREVVDNVATPLVFKRLSGPPWGTHRLPPASVTCLLREPLRLPPGLPLATRAPLLSSSAIVLPLTMNTWFAAFIDIDEGPR